MIKITIIIKPVIMPPLEKVISPLKVICKVINKLMTNKYFEFDNSNNRETKINIPNPNMVDTWLGPKPPDANPFESVPVKISRRFGVYKKR